MKLPASFLGVPLAAAAFASGMVAVSEHPWEVIAGAVSQAGLGTYPSTTIEMAVREFCGACIDAWEDGEVPSMAETVHAVRSQRA